MKTLDQILAELGDAAQGLRQHIAEHDEQDGMTFAAAIGIDELVRSVQAEWHRMKASSAPDAATASDTEADDGLCRHGPYVVPEFHYLISWTDHDRATSILRVILQAIDHEPEMIQFEHAIKAALEKLETGTKEPMELDRVTA